MVDEVELAARLVDCFDVESIQEINDQFNYNDESNDNRDIDEEYVACGQSERYNELRYIYAKYLEEYIEREQITKQEALEALCWTCHTMGPGPKKRDEFYALLSERLGVPVGPS